MPKSEYAVNLTTIVSEVDKQLLKGKGFIKKGNYFNRTTEDGLIQVIGFQSGQYAKSEYGTFVINSGVFVPEIATFFNWKPKAFAYEYDCAEALRGRISAGKSTNDNGISNEVWFSLSDEPLKTVDIIISLIERECTEFLNKLETKERVLAFLKAKPKVVNDRVVLAAMLLHRGEKDEAMSLLKEQYAITENKFHKEYLIKLAERLSLPIDWS
jgi:hypothetical protein